MGVVLAVVLYQTTEVLLVALFFTEGLNCPNSSHGLNEVLNQSTRCDPLLSIAAVSFYLEPPSQNAQWQESSEQNQK